MERNPKTNIKASDNTPAMHSRAMRRRKLNGSVDDKTWGVCP